MDDRINGQCEAADKRSQYQGNNEKSRDQSWLNATSASRKDNDALKICPVHLGLRIMHKYFDCM